VEYNPQAIVTSRPAESIRPEGGDTGRFNLLRPFSVNFTSEANSLNYFTILQYVCSIFDVMEGRVRVLMISTSFMTCYSLSAVLFHFQDFYY